MKQTNNAIKFLLAQYRAIYKHAHLKNIVTASLITAGLALSSASAASGTASFDKITSDTTFTTDSKLSITSVTANSGGSSKTSPYELKFNITLDGSGHSIKNSAIASGSGDMYVKGENSSLTLNNNADLTIGESGSNTSKVIDLRLKNVTLNSGSTLTIYDNKVDSDSGSIASNWKSTTLALSDNLIVNSGTVNLYAQNGSNALLYATKKMEFNDSTINLTTSGTTVNRTSLGDRNFGNWNSEKEVLKGSSITFDNSKLTIKTTGSGSEVKNDAGYGSQIWGDTLTLKNGSNFTVSGSGAQVHTRETLIENSITTIDSGSTLNLVPREFFVNKGDDSKKEYDEKYKASYINGTVQVKGGSFNLGGRLALVRGGTLEFDDKVNLKATKAASSSGDDGMILIGHAGGFNVSGSTASGSTVTNGDINYTLKGTTNSTLKINSTTLNSFLTSKGGVKLLNGGRLTFTDLKEVNVSNFKFSGTASSGTIAISQSGASIGSGSTVDTLSTNILISAKDMRISKSVTDDIFHVASSGSGAVAFVADTLKIGSTTATSASAINVGYVKTNSVQFESKDGVSLSGTVALSVDKDGDGKLDITENSGEIKGDFTIVNNSKFIVDGGNYTMSDDLIVKCELLIGQEKSKFDSALALSGNLTLADSGTITIKGVNNTSEPSIKASLDIRDAKLYFGSGGTTVATINIQDQGTLFVNGSQVEQLLKDVEGNTEAKIVLTEGGLLDVTGNIGSSLNRINDNQFVSGSGSGNNIAFSGGGSLKADTLYLMKSGGLDIGSGTLSLNALNLSTSSADDTSFEFTSGNFNVLSGINVGQYATDLIVKSGAHITLGSPDQTSEVVQGQGSVDLNTTLESGSSLKVYGQWTGKKIVANSASEVAQPTLYIHKSGVFSINELDAQTNSTQIDGVLSVAGIMNTEETPDVSGISLAQGSINLTGTLNLGAGIAEDIKFSDTSTTLSSGGIAQDAINLNGGTVRIEFDDQRKFSLEQLNALKQHLFNDTNGYINGVLDVGKANIGDITLNEEKKENGRYDIKDIASVSGIIGDSDSVQVTNDKLVNNSFYTQTGEDVAAVVGSIHVKTGDTANIKYNAGFVNSSTNNGYFVTANSGSSVKEGNINFSGKQLRLDNGGIAGNISLATGSTLRVAAKNAQQVAVLGNISGGSVELHGNTQAKSVDVENFDVAKSYHLSANDFKVTNKAVYEGNLEVTSGDASFTSGAAIRGNTTVAHGSLKLGASSVIANNAVVKANQVDLSQKIDLLVGQVTEKESSTGYLETTRLNLNGGRLIADPAYGQAFSLVSADKLGTANQVKLGKNILDGQVIAAQNSIIALGVTGSNEASVLEQINTAFLDKVTDGSGQLSAEGIGSIVYVNKALTVANTNNSKIVLDANQSAESYDSELSTNQTYSTEVNGADIYLGANTALVIDEKALGTKVDDVERGAIHFEKTDASIQGNGGKILLAGSIFNANDSITLLTDTDGSVDVKTKDGIEVSSLNGHFRTVLKEGSQTNNVTLEFQKDVALHDYRNLSEPVIDTLMSYSTTDLNWDEQDSVNYKKALVHNGLVKGATVNEQGQVVINGTVAKDQNIFVKVLNDDKTYSVYYAANNGFLKSITKDVAHGNDAETASRFVAFGGAAQAALLSSQNANDVVASRMGMGGANSALSFADNGQGAGLFVAPLYKSHSSDGFKAQGVNYGVDVDLFGLALGGDYTMNNGLRLGLMFNVGSGDADGNGMGKGVSNDFDYYGVAMYAGFSQNNLSVVADVSYSVVDNDISANTYTDKLSAKLDSTALSLGVTANYAMAVGGMDVTPHAGLRFTRLDMDDYTLNGDKYGAIAQVDNEDLNVFSIPVGVSISKEIVSGTWTIKPTLDFTITGNFGDDEVASNVAWTGVENLATKTNSEMLDSFTYGAALGVAAKSGNLSFGLGANYTGSSNTDEYGINANARFVF